MKKKKLIKKIVSFCLFVIMFISFIFLGTRNYQVTVADNIKFSEEFNDISKENIFKYASEQTVLEILNGGSGILFLGFPTNIWSHYYAKYLNQAAIENNIDKIYYYDFKHDRQMNTATYTKIVNVLKEYLYISDTENIDLQAPTIIIVKNGDILYYNDEVSITKSNIDPNEYFTDYKKNLFIANIDNAIKKYMGEE